MSRFRTTELSEPGVSTENLRFITVKSPALKARGDICVFIPPGSDGAKSIPLVLLLHGVYGSHWAWALHGKAHLTTARLIAEGKVPPMAIAMPSDSLWGDGSGYLEHSGRDHEKWIVEDVVDVCREKFEQVDEESPLLISGLSMGGFGALRLGCKYAEKFKAISGHSSITKSEQLGQFVEEPLSSFAFDAIEGPNVIDWAIKNRDNLPPLRFDCGVDDTLIEPNRELHADLDREGIAHEYFEFEGAHSWQYWEEHHVDTLLFFAKALKD